jgi:hypothetical protein
MISESTRLAVVLLPVLLFPAGYCVSYASDPLTLDEIVEHNTEAMGGRAAIEAVKSIEIELHIVDPGFEVDGTYRAMRPDKMRIDVKAEGKPVYTEAYDGKRGWQWTGKGTKTVDESPQATAVLQRGLELPGKLYGLHELREHGHQVALAGREKIDGTDYYALAITMKDGFKTTLYVDPPKWRITRRRDIRPLHIDVDPTPTTIEQKISDFRQVDGVWFPFANTETDLKTGKVLETTTVKDIRLNPPIKESIFTDL